MRFSGVAGRHLLLLIALLLAVLLVPRTGAGSALAQPAGKKHCKLVKRGGKTVKVCTKPKPKPTGTPVPTLGPADRAESLAAALTAATDTPARYTVLLQVMAAIHLGVHSSSGALLVRTAVPGLYLYDFQVKAIAAALGRHQTYGPADVAAFLNALGSTPDNTPLSAEAARGVLAGATEKALAAPNDPSSLLPLLVRNLGMHASAPYDLATNPEVAAIHLDALQLFLIEIDTTIAAVHAIALAQGIGPGPELVAPGRMQAAAMALSGGLLHPAIAARDSGPCDFSEFSSNQYADALKEFLGPVLDYGKYLSEAAYAKWAPQALQDAIDKLISGAGVAAGKALGIVLAIVDDVIGGSLLAYSIHVFPAGDSTQVTHYGPAGHRADDGVGGKQLRFGELVQNLDDYGGTVITCGPYAGLNIPPQGNLKGVKILWLYGGLDAYGKITFDPADGATGDDGVATLVFTPKDEAVPGVGTKSTATGTLTGVARYQSAFGTLSGKIAQYLTPKEVQFSWGVGRHRAAGYKFATMTNVQVASDDASISITDAYSGHVCGEDPFARPWTIHIAREVRTPESSASAAGDQSITIPKDGPATAFTDENGVPLGQLTWKPASGPGDVPHMQLDQRSHPGYSPPTQTQQMEITEDTTDCPPLPSP